ncbi:MAG: TerC family protein [Bryobacteraceae bacterium]|nr:TerC family protein [Bryobacteraceae bacterium]
MPTLLFPFSDYWWFYGAFTLFVLLLLLVDLGVFHRKAHAIGFREAAGWSVVWVTLAVIFGLVLYQYSAAKFDPATAKTIALQFFTGYIIEYSLSVDNMFVFVLVFQYFATPSAYQHRVLFYGILGALIFRAMFIAIGAVLMQYQWVVILFGVFLIISGIRMMFGGEAEVHPEKNPVIRLFRKIVPITPAFHGQQFFVRLNGVLHATPLLVALLFLEMTDIVFAVDSVPAIFALTREPLLVFTSNVFAILGLRSMFFMLAGAVDKFHLLKYGLAIVLIFVGLKMVWLNQAFGGHFPIQVSLGIIASVLAASVIGSLLFPKKSAEVSPPVELASDRD